MPERSIRTRIPALMLALVWLIPVSAPAQSDPRADTGNGDDRPTVGLVLGGGGAKGFAHIGVLRVLEQAGVPIDIIVGTSMGAVVGGLYAAGRSPDELSATATDIDWNAAFQDRGARGARSMRRKTDDRRLAGQLGVGISLGGFELPRGAIQGQRLTQLLRTNLGSAGTVDDFDQLPIRFRPIAVDLETAEVLALERGDLALAIRASMSIPGIVAPVSWDGRLLIDGGMRSNLPIEFARALGADVIIAVDVGSMAPPEPGLTSAFRVMDQTIRLMIRQNVIASIGTLDAGDIYLRINAGDMAVTDFGRAGTAITSGELTARAHLDEIRELAVAPDVHARWLEQLRRAPHARDPIIRSIELDNRSSLDDRVILRHLDVEPGGRLNRGELDASIDRIHGLGYFQRVDYRLHRTGPDTADLELVAEPQSWGPNYLRFGIALEDDFDTRSTYRIAVSYLRTEVNRLGAEFQADLELGSDPQVFTEFWQPIGAGSPWFVAPRISAGRRDVNLFVEGERTGEVRLSQREVGLHLGRTIGTRGEIRAGLEGGDAEIRPLIGDPDIDDREFTTGRYIARATWDGFDAPDFPRSGTAVNLEWRHSSESLGADDPYERITLDAGHAFSFGRNRWIVSGRAGTIGGTDRPPVQALHSLGGFLNLSGYQRDALTGSELVLGQLIYLREVVGYRTIGGLPLFLGGAAESGNVWDSRDERDLDDVIVSGTLIAATDTILGPLYIGYGVSDDGEANAYLSLGRTF